MKTFFTYAVLIALFGCIVSNAEDAKLQRLEARLSSADTQTDTNIASGEIADYLDKKLTAKEAEIMKKLDQDALKLFQKASKLWRDFRLAQSAFERDIYRGGSIRPLIYNEAFASVTQERITALTVLSKEVMER